MNAKDYSKDIETLEKLYESLQQNVYFSINIIIAILSVALVIAGWALSVLAKQWVDKRINQELDLIDKRIKEHINKNPQFYFASGNAGTSRIDAEEALKLHGIKQMPNSVTLSSFKVHGLKNFSKEKLVSFEVIDSSGNLLDKEINIDNNGVITVTLHKNIEGQVSWTAVWLKEDNFEQRG
jgi:phosphoserine aminotransferase